MDDILKRLLDAELRAERLAQEAEAEQERVIQEALALAKAQDEQLTLRVPELRRSYIAKAEERAEQVIAELRRRYDERHIQLREQAERHEQAALEAAFQVLIALGH